MSRSRDSPVQKWDSVQESPTTDDERLAGDRELYRILNSEGFEGKNFDDFVGVLIQYGFAVLRGWALKGQLYSKCRERNVRGLPKKDPLSNSSFDEARREELAADIVADGIIRFIENAMRGGGWKPAGRASMRTYFVGGCLFSAAPHLTALARELALHESRVLLEQDVVGNYLAEDTGIELTDNSGDIADKVAGRLKLQGIHEALSKTDLEILAMEAEGIPRKDIGRKLGTSSKGVASRIARIRRDIKRLENKEAG